MKKIILLLIQILLLNILSAKNINGIIVDATTGEALIGASVYIKQSPKTGSTTGLDGKFKLSTDIENPILVCSYLGYETQEIKSLTTNFLTIKMVEATYISKKSLIIFYIKEVASNFGATSVLFVG